MAASGEGEEEPEVNLAPPVMTITVSSSSMLQLTMTKTCLEMLTNLGKVGTGKPQMFLLTLPVNLGWLMAGHIWLGLISGVSDQNFAGGCKWIGHSGCFSD